MTRDLRDFWRRLQTGIAVAVSHPTPDKLLGVRDGFVRYFRDGFGHAVSVAVVPQGGEMDASGLPVDDGEVIAQARGQVRRLAEDLGDTYHFYAASEGGFHHVEVEGETLYFIRSWTAIRGPVGEAVGGSGSVQIPDRIIAGLTNDELPFAVPGRRRQGGLISSLTGGLENRRRATALSTVHALSALFYGVLEGRPGSYGD